MEMSAPPGVDLVVGYTLADKGDLKTMRFNTTKRLLQAGKPAIGAWLNFPCVNVAEVMAHAGWDWVTVDAEHGPMTIEMLSNGGIKKILDKYDPDRTGVIDVAAPIKEMKETK